MQNILPVTYKGKEYYGASDAHIYVLIPVVGDYLFQIPEKSEIQDIAAIIKDTEENVRLNAVSLYQKYDEIEMITRKIRHKCECCDGDKEFEHYGEFYDCKTCNETGYIECEQTETILNPKKHFKILKTHLKSKSVEKLITILKVAEAKNIIITYSSSHIIQFETNNGLLIGIAGMWNDEDENYSFLDILS